MQGPDKDIKFPLENYQRLCFLKNIITNPNIIVGDYTYYDDFEDATNIEKNVKYLFDITGDRLIIGKFCMIASDVTFIYEWRQSSYRGYLCLPVCCVWQGLGVRHEWKNLSQ